MLEKSIMDYILKTSKLLVFVVKNMLYIQQNVWKMLFFDFAVGHKYKDNYISN